MIPISVVIASTNRPTVLAETVRYLNLQKEKPLEVILSLIREGDLDPSFDPGSAPFPIKVLTGEPGLTKQRNRGIASVDERAAFVCLLDDDVLIHEDFLGAVCSIMEDHADCVCVMGHLARNGDVSLEEAKKLLAGPIDPAEAAKAYIPVHARHGGLYGCNMTFRKEPLQLEKFDERLPLYSEMEDTDMGTRIRKHGVVAYSFRCQGVHLKTQSGRINYRMHGFSQIMNAWYLMKKGSLPRGEVVLKIVARKLLQNALMVFHPRQTRKRLALVRGNIFALRCILAGRVEPELITKLR